MLPESLVDSTPAMMYHFLPGALGQSIVRLCPQVVSSTSVWRRLIFQQVCLAGQGLSGMPRCNMSAACESDNLRGVYRQTNEQAQMMGNIAYNKHIFNLP